MAPKLSCSSLSVDKKNVSMNPFIVAGNKLSMLFILSLNKKLDADRIIFDTKIDICGKHLHP